MPGEREERAWQSVPVVATDEMERAYYRAHAEAETVFASFDTVWAEVLAATPPAEAQDAGDTTDVVKRLDRWATYIERKLYVGEDGRVYGDSIEEQQHAKDLRSAIDTICATLPSGRGAGTVTVGDYARAIGDALERGKDLPERSRLTLAGLAAMGVSIDRRAASAHPTDAVAGEDRLRAALQSALADLTAARRAGFHRVGSIHQVKAALQPRTESPAHRSAGAAVMSEITKADLEAVARVQSVAFMVRSGEWPTAAVTAVYTDDAGEFEPDFGAQFSGDLYSILALKGLEASAIPADACGAGEATQQQLANAYCEGFDDCKTAYGLPARQSQPSGAASNGEEG